MGQKDANVSRYMFDERKRYIRPIAQQSIPWVDADQNDGTEATLTHLRRAIQSTMGDGFVNDGFKIRENDDNGIRYNGNTNNFVVVGQALTVTPRTAVDEEDGQDAGAYFIDGLRCALFGDVIYDADDPIPDQAGDPDEVSQASIFPRVTEIEYTGGNTVITDSAQNYVTNELTSRTISFLNGGALGSYSIASNTATTITINGTDLSSSVYVNDRYRLDLSTPSGSDRTDGVYLNVYLDQVNAPEDAELYHSLNTPTEAQIREQIVQEIFVREDITTHGEITDYEDADGNKHYVQKLVEIDRLNGNDTITTAMIQADNITQFGSILQSSPFQTYGSSQHANDSSAVDNMPVNGTWPNAPATVPNGGYWIAREIDDDAPQNKAGYYSNVAGTWTWMFEVEVETASDVSYDNTTSGLTATDVQDAIDEVVDDIGSAIDAATQYTMYPGDGTTEFNDIMSAIETAGSGKFKVTFMPDTYNITVKNDPVGWNIGSADITLHGYGTEQTQVNFNKNAGQTSQSVVTTTGTISAIGFDLGDIGDWDDNGDILFDCGNSSFAIFEGLRITGSAGGINMKIMNAGVDTIVRQCDFQDDCIVDVSHRSIIENCRQLHDVTMENQCKIVNCYSLEGTITMGLDGKIDNVTQISGTVTQGDFSVISNTYLTNDVTQGVSCSMDNVRIYGNEAEINQGNRAVAKFYGENVFQRFAQGDRSMIMGGFLRCDGNYALQSPYYEWISQNANSSITGCDIEISDILPWNASQRIIKQGAYCQMTGCFVLWTLNETWSFSNYTLTLLQSSSFSSYAGTVIRTIQGSQIISGDNNEIRMVYSGVDSSAPGFIYYYGASTMSDTGTGNKITFTIRHLSGSRINASPASIGIGTVEADIDYISGSSVVVEEFTSTSLKATGCYLYGDIPNAERIGDCQVNGDVTCNTVRETITGNYINGDLIGHAGQSHVANNWITGSTSVGGAMLIGNTITGTHGGTWSINQHNN